jgi:hypothetical protein
MGIGAMMEF